MEAVATHYAPKAQLEAWLSHAQPGHSAIYAIGAALDQAEPVVALVNDWIKTGEVAPVQRRVNGQLRYEVQRREKAPEGEEPAVQRRYLDEAFAETPEGKLLQHLRRLAGLGQPCPSNAKLAEACGLRDAEAARYRFNNLIKAGHITVTVDGERRTVTIRATGKRTAGGQVQA